MTDVAMSGAPGPGASGGAAGFRSLAAALDEVGRWRASSVARLRADAAETDTEIDNLRKSIENLQQQIEALRRSREAFTQQEAILPDEEVKRTHHAIFGVLLEQRAALEARGTALQDLESARRRALELSFNDPALASALQEYTQFKTTVEPTLKLLPESYRGVLQQHHDGVSRRLREHVEKASAGVVELRAPALPVDVVYAVDSPSGSPEVVMLVLPVAEAVHAEWATRAEDLQTLVAARVVQALYTVCQGAGLVQARAAFGGHQGLLAIEMEIAGAKPDFAALLGEEIGRLAASQEIAAARVEIRSREVMVDHLIPPDAQE